MFWLPSCSNSIPFQGSDVVPAAEAKVAIDQDNNNNYKVDIDVENLAMPEKLHPPKKVYIAWYQSDDNSINKLGRMIVSGNLKASLETVVPRKPTKVFITAEQDPEVDYPGTDTILETRNF